MFGKKTSASTSKSKVLLDDFEDVANRKGKVLLDDFEDVANGKAEGSITFKFIYQPLTPRVSVNWDFWFRQRMSSIDTYSTTKDLVFDEWVASYKSDEMVIEVFFRSCFFFCPLDYPSGQILDLRFQVENDRDCEKMFELANFHGYLDVYVGHNPQVILLDWYFKKLEVVCESDEEVTSKYRSHKKAREDSSTMSLEELIAWEQEETQSPSYIRSPHVWEKKWCWMTLRMLLWKR
ncbi:hypothetical protein Tco_1126064 [Tanacetum coccineum]